MTAVGQQVARGLAVTSLATALVVVSACTPAGDSSEGSAAPGNSARTPARGAQLGALAPGLEVRTLDGEPVSLGSFRGSPVLLNVWATWCHPCRDEIPVLEGLHQAHGRNGLKVVGVSIDDAGRMRDVRRFATEFGVSYAIWHDPDQRVMPSFSVIGVPTTFLIDRDGRLVWRKTGEVKAGDPGLTAALDSMLPRGGGD